MNRVMRAALISAGVFTALPLLAQTPPDFDAAKVFGARESIAGLSLSPDGARILYLAPLAGQATAVYVAELAGGTPVRVFTADGDPERLTGCNWITSERMLCNVRFAVRQDGRQVGFVRQVAVNRDGSVPKLLGSRQATAQSLGSIIGVVPDGSGQVYNMFGGMTGTVTSGNGLEQLDTVTLKTRKILSPKPGAVEYILDDRGEPRIMGTVDQPESGYANGIVRYSWRPVGGDWTALSTVLPDDKGFNPYVVDRERNLAYGFDKVDGRQALVSVKLEPGLARETVLARPDVDVDGLIQIGQRGRVIGATYATERREMAYFDPQMKALAASLAKALPNLPLVRIIDADAGENKLLIWAGSDRDPGRIYTFERSTKRLNEVMLVRPRLEKVALAAVKPVTFAAADGTRIPAYLTLPPNGPGRNIPAIVMPHGGPGARDEWGFDWLAQFYAQRGYAVLQPNFRGSTGYGEAWFVKNGFKSWRIAIGDVTDAGRWLVKEGIADPAKLAIVGWSYGGYAALQSGVVDPQLFKAIVAIAPVTDFALWRDESKAFSNRRIMEEFVGKGPHLVEGSPARNADRIAVPVLMFHGTLDENVGIANAQAMEKALRQANKPVELITYAKLDHQLDDSTARADMLAKSDAFLRKTLGM